MWRILKLPIGQRKDPGTTVESRRGIGKIGFVKSEHRVFSLRSVDHRRARAGCTSPCACLPFDRQVGRLVIVFEVSNLMKTSHEQYISRVRGNIKTRNWYHVISSYPTPSKSKNCNKAIYDAHTSEVLSVYCKRIVDVICTSPTLRIIRQRGRMRVSYCLRCGRPAAFCHADM